MSQLYDVEEIVGLKYNKRRRQWMYQIKWLGYDSSQNTWEPETNLKHLGDLLEKFKEKNCIAGARKPKITENEYQSEPKLMKKTIIEKNSLQPCEEIGYKAQNKLPSQNQETFKSHINLDNYKVQLDQLITLEFYNFLRKFKGNKSQRKQKNLESVLEDQKITESVVNIQKESGSTDNILILKKSGDELIILSDKE